MQPRIVIEGMVPNALYARGNGKAAHSRVGSSIVLPKGIVANGLQSFLQADVGLFIQGAVVEGVFAHFLNPAGDRNRLHSGAGKRVTRDLILCLFHFPFHRLHRRDTAAQLHAGELIAVVEGILAHLLHIRKVKGGGFVLVPLIGKDGVVVVIKRALANVGQIRGVLEDDIV